MDELTVKQLKDLGEDAPNDEAERMIDAYRRQRILAERKADKKARFGRVYPIGRDDYTREVTEASAIDEDDDTEEKGTGVVCFLYKDGYVLFPLYVLYKLILRQPQVTSKRTNIHPYSRTRRKVPSLQVCLDRRRQMHSQPPRLPRTHAHHLSKRRNS